MSSDYALSLGADTRCNFLCSKTYSAEETGSFSEKIENEYTVNWILDGLPGGLPFIFTATYMQQARWWQPTAGVYFRDCGF